MPTIITNTAPSKSPHSTPTGLPFLLAVLCCCLLNLTSPQTYAADTAPGLQTTEAELRELLYRKRKDYNHWFPEIEFVLLEGGDAWVDDMITASTLLGHQPVSLDYEHTPADRETLIILTGVRLRHMLRTRMPSATLYKADKPLGWRDNICVLTISPQLFAAADFSITDYLFDPADDASAPSRPVVHKAYRREFLEFVFDHEAFHCLDSLYNGPQPMSQETYWAEYYHYRNENGADAFGAAMHIRRHQQVTPFLNHLRDLRGAALLVGDSAHWTPQIIDRVATTDIGQLDTPALFRLASRLRDQALPDYDAYLAYQCAVREAASDLGLNAQAPPDAGRTPPPALTGQILQTTKDCYARLTGRSWPAPDSGD